MNAEDDPCCEPKTTSNYGQVDKDRKLLEGNI